ncbi:MAG: hypothetical protein ABW128_12475, partial [Rhizorhabdus sp.]
RSDQQCAAPVIDRRTLAHRPACYAKNPGSIIAEVAGSGTGAAMTPPAGRRTPPFRAGKQPLSAR